jgi:hypothetical protein
VPNTALASRGWTELLDRGGPLLGAIEGAEFELGEVFLEPAGDIAIDWKVLLFALSVSLICRIGFGLAPALRSSRVNLQQVLRQNSQGRGRARLRLQELFAAVEWRWRWY